jgi:hypothetical protein
MYWYGAVTLLLTLPAAGLLVAQNGSYRPQRAPVVETTADGQRVLHLNEQQEAAIGAFEQSHPDFLLANCHNLHLTSDDCKSAYEEWEGIARQQKAEVQFPFAAWGDFNHDGQLDVVLAFFSKTSVNSWGWRNWRMVVFQGNRDGSFTPVIAMKDTWGTRFDGMIYHPVRKQIEYWCGSAGGSFRWNGSTYVGKRMKGD